MQYVKNRINMKNLIFVLLASIAVAMAYPANDNLVDNIGDGNEISGDLSPHWINLGRVGNKFYFVDRDMGNWTTAKLLCESSGMQLATIETLEERDFLSSKYEYSVFHGWHWTAARDSHKLSQLTWDNKGGFIAIPIPLYFDGGFIDEEEFQTCGIYYIDEERSGMMLHRCDAPGGWTLCESE